MSFEIVNKVRQVCRACHNICFVHPHTPIHEKRGFRCEGCEAADYERHDFDKSAPPPEPDEVPAAEAVESPAVPAEPITQPPDLPLPTPAPPEPEADEETSV